MVVNKKPWYDNPFVIVIIIFVCLGVFFIISNNTKDEPHSSPALQSQSENQLEVVYVGGIESGDCLVPNVNLWSKPGGASTGATVTGVVDGCVGLPVQVIETKNIPPRTYYHIQTYGASAGKSGWVSETLIIKN